MKSNVFVSFILILLCACSAPQPSKETQDIDPKANPEKGWVMSRVRDAENRLNKTEAGKLVWKFMEFHGGLLKWWSQGPISFRFNYQPRNGTGTPRDTYETADYWRSLTRHQRSVNSEVEYGWDGEKAWVYPDSASIPYNIRFWALTPYYFVGMPFVFADEGINIELEEDTDYEGVRYKTVRITFEQGMGDAPDDFYVLYIHPETYRLSAIRYVVSYPAYFPNGGHTQEKLMTYEGQQVVEGITLPEKHRTFMWEADGSVGDYVTDITLSEVKFSSDTLLKYFEAPAGSRALRSLAE